MSTQIHLGLGSNLGDRRANLRAAIAALRSRGVVIERVSPTVESPALLPEGARSLWNKPYLNLAVQARTELGPYALLAAIKRIEAELGRERGERWAPRTIDIDILLYGDETIRSDALQVPHAGLTKRSFVLTPLVALDPGLVIPGSPPRTVLECSRAIGPQIPVWMGIMNITPDSFSDGGLWQSWERVETHVEQMVDAGAQIIDIGAESTRPGAEPIGVDAEWRRLAPILEPLIGKYAGDDLGPRISVDTYHADVARRALDAGAHIVNDVGGIESQDMIELAASSNAEWVAMHAVSIPADPKRTLPETIDAAEQINDWIEERKSVWRAGGIDLDRVYLDPGIGFGKTPLQSLQILRAAGSFREHGLRTLIGHSRKSFMSSFAAADERTRDMTTIGASLNLIAQGVDVIRVHNVIDHITAYRGWAHLNQP